MSEPVQSPAKAATSEDAPTDAGSLPRIEEELAHLWRTTDDLSEVVARQEREIAALTRKVTLLLERAAEAEADQSGGAVFAERPPHY